MSRFRNFCFAGLLSACVAPSPFVLAQSAAKVSPSSVPDALVPSDSAMQAGSVTQSELPSPKKNSAQTLRSGAGNARSMLAGASTGKSQGLCFQPGVGWVPIPPSSSNATGRSTAVIPLAQTEDSAQGATPGTANTRTVATAHVKSNQCSGDMIGSEAAVAGIEGLTTTHSSKSSQTTLSGTSTTSTNPGTQNWLQADSVLNPASSSASLGLKMGLGGSTLSSSKRYSQSTGSSVSADSLRSFEGNAYVSPIKLRRMMRNAPDLETRLRLDRLARKQKSSTQKKKSNISTDRSSERKPKENGDQIILHHAKP